MTMSENFKQFFTPTKYSQILINELDIISPQKIIDLAMGEGALLIEAKKIWRDSILYGNDIDPLCCQKLSSNHSNIYCTNYDIFQYKTIELLVNDINQVDLCIGNPPFHKITKDENIKKLLNEYNLSDKYKGKYISSEIPFILQSLKILKNNGTLALILPDGFFTNDSLLEFRKLLILNYNVQKVLELPRNIFKNTQAKTHILILKKTLRESSFIRLSNLESNYLNIHYKDAIKRMDYSFYEYTQCNKKNYQNEDKLKDCAYIFRGKSKYLLKDISNKHILHTTSFKNKNIFYNKLKSTKSLNKYANKFVIPGDIVLARVGSSVVGKIGIVKEGFFVPTDCLIIIRVDENLRNEIFSLLKCISGQEWIHAHTKGVAAQHITIEDIKNFPINIKDTNNV